MAKLISKTFKIGEYAKGGVITIEIKNGVISVIGKDWDFSTGSKKSSDQSNAEEFWRTEISVNDFDVERKLSDELNYLTTSYYTGEIMKWISSKTNLKFIW